MSSHESESEEHEKKVVDTEEHHDDASLSDSEDHDEHNDHHDSVMRAESTLQKQKFLARRDIEFDVPDEVWLQERRCLLMLLEARMLLRELVEYKVKLMRTASGNLTISEIQNLLALYGENDEDGDFISGTYLPFALLT